MNSVRSEHAPKKEEEFLYNIQHISATRFFTNKYKYFDTDIYIFLISNKQDAYQLFLTLWNTELWTLSALRPIKDLAQRRHSYTK